MIKTLSLIKRRPDISRDQFREHYETVHAPLALPHMTGLVRYVRYHVDEEFEGQSGDGVGFDVLSGFWYRDAESTAQMMETLQGEAGKPILADELTFMDKPANTFFPVSERMLVAGDEGDEHLWVLIRKPDAMSRYDASARLADVYLPKLLERIEGVGFALLRDAFPVDGGELRHNGILQIRAEHAGGLEAWSLGMRESGYVVTAVRTTRHETDLPAA